ncbi:MAG: alpha/beta fold hydrolase [Bacteroidota bacterium]
MRLAWLLIGLLFCGGCDAPPPAPVETTNASPLSIEGLRARSYTAAFQAEGDLATADSCTRQLYSYRSDSLRIFALVQRPLRPAPAAGYPVVLFGHGYHPDPPRYGISNATGINARPGDYYRGVPAAYAAQGYLTVTPDYRGHNRSEGFEYTQTRLLATTYYAIDVLHALAALESLADVNLEAVYYVGHSMGGDVGLKTLLATDRFKAASLWSAVTASVEKQVVRYGQRDPAHPDRTVPRDLYQRWQSVDSVVSTLGFAHDLSEGDPTRYLDLLGTPLALHHATRETVVPYAWAESLAADLYARKKQFVLYAYDSDRHLFQGENFQKAVARDVALFQQYANSSKNLK